jgi:hypothetical protein
MLTEQLLQMPAVHTDRFSVTGFATFTAPWTEIKQILQKLNQTEVITIVAFVSIHSALYTTHYTLHTIHYTLYTTHYTLHTIHYTLYTTHYTLYTTRSNPYIQTYTLYNIFPINKPFCCSAPFKSFNTKLFVVMLVRMSSYTQLVLMGLLEFGIIQWKKLC